MKKLLTFVFLFLLVLCPQARGAKASLKLPDNIYFRAMRDEMNRTLKELRAKDSPNLYYVAYKLIHASFLTRQASFGELYPFDKLPATQLDALVVLGVGSDKNDQLGFENNRFYYEPQHSLNVPVSYDGIRRMLWLATDAEYLVSSDSFMKKQAYKRQKALRDDLPDRVAAPQAAVFEEMDGFSFPDAKKWEDVIKKLSARGKKSEWLENFTVSVEIDRDETYYLNSLGGAYQIPFANGSVKLTAQLRNKDGYRQRIEEKISLTDLNQPDEKMLSQKTDEFLLALAEMYNAYQAEAYLGPILLRPRAAAHFIMTHFGLQAENVKPLLSADTEQDQSAGSLRDKKGMRVIANVVDVFDKPQMREYNGHPLVFMPVDDEGVASRELQLTSLGRLRELPLTRRPLNQDHQSNGHARMSLYSYPRETLTNLFVEAKNPLSQDALDQEFLAVCQDWGLEYCYEVDAIDDGSGAVVNRAWRVYAEDGRKVPVFAMDLLSLSSRSLRDIIAAGADSEVFYLNGDALRRTVVTPSLLLEEAEILQSDVKPDKPTFIPKP